MDQYGYIYKTTNMVNGKIYIGQHKGVFDRSYLGSGKIILDAIKKYGEHSFSVEPISFSNSKEHSNELEVFYISEHRRNRPEGMIYNISNGGEAPMAGRKHSDETRKKWEGKRSGSLNGMFGVHLTGKDNPMWGKKHSEETKRKISDRLSKIRGEAHGNFGKVRSMDARKKMGVSKLGNRLCVGRILSDETKDKIRNAQIQYHRSHANSFLGKKHSEETRAKMKLSAIRRRVSA